MSLIYSQKIQVISLFHHLRFTRYKYLLSNAQRFKGKLSTVNANTKLKLRKIKVNGLWPQKVDHSLLFYSSETEESVTIFKENLQTITTLTKPDTDSLW